MVNTPNESVVSLLRDIINEKVNLRTMDYRSIPTVKSLNVPEATLRKSLRDLDNGYCYISKSDWVTKKEILTIRGFLFLVPPPEFWLQLGWGAAARRKACAAAGRGWRAKHATSSVQKRLAFSNKGHLDG
jgi:hypothetical protein